MSKSTAPFYGEFRARGAWLGASARLCLAGGVALTALGSLGLLTRDPAARAEFKFAYLAAVVYCLSFGLGALFFVMIQHVTGAKWSVTTRRIAEQLMMTLPLTLLLFVPVLCWLRDLYPWTHPLDLRDPHAQRVLAGKAAYLNVPFFTARALFYFAIWIGLAIVLRSKSLRQDNARDPKKCARLRLSMSRWSAPGLLLFALTVTFAAFDWLMGLSPLWYSTIYGVYYFAGCAVGGLALLILLAALVERSGDADGAITTEHFHDLGKLLFGFVVFWAYIAFSQLLLIWMANKPEETRWFYDRWRAPGWRAVSWALLFGHFVLPFLFLLPRTIKRLRPTLLFGAAWMVAAHYLDIYWLVMPAVAPDAPPLSPREPALAMGLLLLLCACALFLLGRDPLVPRRDPFLEESMKHEND
jgi:hypothetical protein